MDAPEPSPPHRYGSSRVFRFRRFPWHREAGSPVPHQSLCPTPGASMRVTVGPVSRHPSDLSQDNRTHLVLMTSVGVSTRTRRFTSVQLHGTHLTRSRIVFSAPRTTTDVVYRRVRWFGTSSCRAVPRGLPSFQVQHDSGPLRPVCLRE